MTTWREAQSKYPIPAGEQVEYDQAYAEATLAGELAELVYQLRVDAGLTQTELARRMGTTQSSIARIEAGGSLPSMAVLAKLSRATGTPLHVTAPTTAIDVALDQHSHCPKKRKRAGV